MIWVSASLTLSEASWAWSLASWAPAAAMLACVLVVEAVAFSWARFAWSAAMEAWSALIAAVVAGDVSVASTWPAFTAWPSWTGTLPTRPAFAKFRLVTPLLLTEPVKDRLSDRAIRGTYQSAAATTMAAIRMPPTICGAVTGRRLGPLCPGHGLARRRRRGRGYLRPAPQPPPAPPAPAPGLRSPDPGRSPAASAAEASCAAGLSSRTCRCPCSPSGPWSSASESVPPPDVARISAARSNDRQADNTGMRPHNGSRQRTPGFQHQAPYHSGRLSR